MNIRRLSFFISIIITLLIAPTANSETFYRWVDEKGVTHVTDQPPANKAANGKDIKEVYMDSTPRPSHRIPDQVTSSGLRTSPGITYHRIPIHHNNYGANNPSQQEASLSPPPYSAEQPQYKSLPPRPTHFQSDAQAMQAYDRRVRDIKEYNAQLSQEYEKRVNEYEKRVKEIDARNTEIRKHNALVANQLKQQQLEMRQEHERQKHEMLDPKRHASRDSIYKPYVRYGGISDSYADRPQATPLGLHERGVQPSGPSQGGATPIRLRR
jgi:hypothetical protein